MAQSRRKPSRGIKRRRDEEEIIAQHTPHMKPPTQTKKNCNRQNRLGTVTGVSFSGVSLTLCCSVVYSTRRFVLCLTLWHFVLVVSVLLALQLPRLEKRELILVLFVRLFDLCLFGFVGFLFLLVSGKGYGLWLWHSLDFCLTPFFINQYYSRETSPLVLIHCQLNY